MADRLAWESKGLVHFFSGVLTGAELLSAIEMAHADPRFDDAQYAIADFSGCTDLVVTQAESDLLSAIAGAAAKSRKETSRSAFVVSDPRLLEKFEHFIRSPLSPSDTRIFSSLEEARRWAMRRS